MKRNVKKGLPMIGLAILMTFISVHSVDAVEIYYKNKRIPPAVEPVIDNGRTMVPVVVIAEAMGAEVHWDENEKTLP